MKQRSFHKLVKRYLMIATTVPVMIFGIYLYVSQTAQYSEELESFVENVFLTFEQNIQEFNKSNTQIVKLFTLDQTIKEAYDIPENDENVFALINHYDSIHGGSIALGLKDGRMFTRNQSLLPKDYDPRVRPWYQDTLASDDEVFVSKPYKSAIDDTKFSVTYSMKSYSQVTGEVVGVVGLDVDMNELLNLEARLRIPVNMSIILTDGAETVLKQIGEPLRMDGDALKTLLTAEKTTKLNGESYRVFVDSELPNGWYLIALIPNTALQSKNMNILQFTIFIIMLMILLSLMYARKISHNLVTPIEFIIRQLEMMSVNAPQGVIEGHKNEAHEIEQVRIAINEKQEEIVKQYMEIESLYEETTAMNETLNEMVDTLNNSWMETIRVLSNAIEANDNYTRGHCDRVTEYSLAIATSLKDENIDINQLEFAALLHDVGKVSVPYHILNSESKLSSEERETIQKHPMIGFQIVEEVSFLKNAAKFILYHHEYYDGNGYPFELKGDNIPIESRILAVADAYDAMTTARSYRKIPLSHEDAIEELLAHSGSQFDESIVKAFVVSGIRE